MLSILIPVYNINCFPLVESLVRQLDPLEIDYEIRCVDDASTITFEDHLSFEKWGKVSYTILKKNIGRSRIRNLLASKAAYNWLLFLDADTLPTHDGFVSKYITIINSNPQEKVFSGGLAYREKDLTNTNHLRYKYGKSRESIPVEKREKEPYTSLLMSNTLVKKSVFERVQFNDKINLYGHEDAVFSYDLYGASIPIKHIDNAVYHTGLESNKVFIKKSKIAVKNLRYLYLQGLIHPEINRLLKYYTKARFFFLLSLFSSLYKRFYTSFEKKLSDENPSLALFDIYRFSYLCYLSKMEK